MFSATHFTYDGVFSGNYGLILADFDDSSVVETASFSPVLNTRKPALLNRFYHNGVSYEEMPQHRFSVISETEIDDFRRREIMSWLIGRREFKVLKIHQEHLVPYFYRCVFTGADIIYINGRCHGFRLTASFDSPYAYGEPTVASVTSGTKIIKIFKKYDISDDYVYPIVKFTGTSVSITNNTDDSKRSFVFSGLSSGETITVDNEIKYISGGAASELFANFNKNWLRLRKGENVLKIVADGDVTITCPHYAMIGF